MSETPSGSFACQACGRIYAWKAEYAGRRLKCKCGQSMGPLTAPTPVPDNKTAGAAASTCPSCGSPLEPSAILCVQCGFNLKTNSRMSTHVDVGKPDKKK